MPRHTPHAAIRRTSLSAAEAHSAHGRSPFVGCPACERRAALQPLQIRLSRSAAR